VAWIVISKNVEEERRTHLQVRVVFLSPRIRKNHRRLRWIKCGGDFDHALKSIMFEPRKIAVRFREQRFDFDVAGECALPRVKVPYLPKSQDRGQVRKSNNAAHFGRPK